MTQTDTLADLASSEGMAVLAAAPSSTDSMARLALAELGYDVDLVTQLRRFGFLTEAGGEWRLNRDLRTIAIDRALKSDQATWTNAHEFYLAQASDDSVDAPTYLWSGPGVAFHTAEIDHPEGLEIYRELAHIESSVISKQSLILAKEQTTRGVIDANSVEFAFLEGMSFYRNGRKRESIAILRKISGLDDESQEVAVAQHLVGHWDCLRGLAEDRQSARDLLTRSHQIGEDLHDLRHLAHVKHSMALCILKDAGSDQTSRVERRRAVALLRESLSLLEAADDEFGRAKVMHSLGRALTADPERRSEGSRLLAQSRQIGIDLGYMRHVQIVDKTVAKMRSPQRRKRKKR